MNIALMFSGQGAQHVGMGKSLAEASPAVAALYREADEVLGIPFSRICFEGPLEELTRTDVCQPALFVQGIALLRLLEEKGMPGKVVATLGLSLGELTALTAAGSLDFAAGLKTVAERGRLMQLACDETRGAMASIIGESEEKVAALCQEFDIDIANLNCPGQIVISGDAERVAKAVESAREKGFRRVIPLNVAGAYHSRLMEPARVAFEKFLEDIPLQQPEVPVFANVDGLSEPDPGAIRRKLVRQVVSSVRWEDCLRNAVALGVDAFLELGPGAVLAGLARRTDKAWKVISLAEFDDLGKLAEL